MICSYCFYLQQQVSVKEDESQHNTEDSHSTEEQNQCPSPPKRKAPSSLLKNFLGATFAGARVQQPISAYAEAE